MTNEVLKDKAGITYLGGVQFINNKIAYPDTFFFTGYSHSAIASGLTSFLTSAGVNFDSIPSQTDFNNLVVPMVLYRWKPLNDNEALDQRYHARVKSWNGTASSGAWDNQLFADNGSILYTNDGHIDPIQGLIIDFQDSGQSGIYWAGNCDGYSINLFCCNWDVANNTQNSMFVHQGLLADPNPVEDPVEGGLFTKDIVAQSITFIGRNPISGQGFNTPTTFGQIDGQFYQNGIKKTLATGDANYPITCSDGQNPTSEWSTYYVPFLDDPVLGAPKDGVGMGKVRGLIYLTGTDYIIGKPFPLTGFVLPEPTNGFNAWMPVLKFNDKTLAMRVYAPSL